jgi:hypothetical protein
MPYKNISPDLWGPHLWKFMHLFTLTYPNEPTEEEKDIAYNFFTAIQTVLPCEKCRYNFKNHLETLTEEVLDSNESLVKWLFDIHNEVNKTTGKPQFSFDNFISMYITNANKLNVTNIDKKEDKIDNINDSMKELIKQEFRKELKDEIMAELEMKNININKVDKVDKINKVENKFLNKLKNSYAIWIVVLILILIFIIYLNKRF